MIQDDVSKLSVRTVINIWRKEKSQWSYISQRLNTISTMIIIKNTQNAK